MTKEKLKKLNATQSKGVSKMKYMNKTITDIRVLLDNNEVTPSDLISESLEVSHEVQDKCNAFVTILDDAKASDKNDNILNNIPYGIKSNYSTHTCNSR